ncbi:MAG: hypothetical protein CMM50_02290 [Rhodospirillaceae bacterium]|nr:hypothetical protein [Rhodospirillaceae bacterium]|tara:strand:- start:105 stop:368 length:264 start_codon:yes stop_codon:yes gene_type:complete
MTDRRLLKLLFWNGSAGIIGAFAFVTLLFFFDIAGLGRLASGSESAWWVAVLLYCGTAVTFGSVAMGVAIMKLGVERDSPDGLWLDD